MNIIVFLGFCLLSIVSVLAKNVEYIPDTLTERRLTGRQLRGGSTIWYEDPTPSGPSTTYFYNTPTAVADLHKFFDGIRRHRYMTYRVWTNDERLIITDLPMSDTFPEIVSKMAEKVHAATANSQSTIRRINIEVETFENDFDVQTAYENFSGDKFLILEGQLQPESTKFATYTSSVLDRTNVTVYSKKREYLSFNLGTGWQQSDVTGSTIYLFLGGPFWEVLTRPDAITMP